LGEQDSIAFDVETTAAREAVEIADQREL